ncbi:MAG: NADH-quinone oxidoreductase subunit L [Candidatus Omnitrophica bacterium]|nr:NADH-quinone oxidoreductase subunit L [Candidatus Omnitrophota bacterium]
MNFCLTTILLPLYGAFLILALPKRLKPSVSVLILGLTFLSSIGTALSVSSQKYLVFSKYLFDWFSISFVGDGLSVFMALVSSFVALLIAVYSLEYMSHYKEAGEFYFWMVLFVGSMMGLVFSANFLLLFCFWEVTSVCSWKLIGFYRKEKDILAADRAFLVTFFGASMLLIGIILVFLQFQNLDLNSLKGMVLVNPIAFFILAGVISKSAQLPLQTWLPDAGVAPTPVTALLHAAVLVKIGVYVFARIFGLTFIASPFFFNTAIVISVLTILVAAGSALVENNIKRILAYSTISQLGYILLAFSLNSQASFKIALIYILAHSLAKAGLFLCAGIIEQKTGTKDINELGGLIKTMPFTAGAYLLCAFSIIGIPPFLGFWPKFMTVVLTIQSGHIAAGVSAIIGALFTLFYLMRVFNKVFLGETKVKASEEKRLMVWVVLVLGILSLALGVVFTVPFNFVAGLMK